MGAGEGAGLALAGAGSASNNTIGDITEASIRNSTINTSYDVEVFAKNSALIDAAAGADAASIGAGLGAGLGFAIGVSVSINDIGPVSVGGFRGARRQRR